MTAGIVCEYNPFHNGHLYQIEKTGQAGADYIVCVMSGNFVQRGECAFFDKWLRARAAILCGADVVIDLPVPWACSSAENFARGSVGLLCDFGIDVLSFGCETDDAELLILCAEALSDKDTGALVKKKMSEGLSYPSALSEAVGEVYGKSAKEVLSSPNSILAAEYIKALKNLSPETGILPVKRKGSAHDSDETDGVIASASLIRSLGSFKESESLIPEKAYSLFKDADIYRMAKGERAILSSLREMNKEDYSLYVTDNQGLANRIFEAVKSASSLEELYDKAKSKNYTHSRIRREVMSLYLKVPKDVSKGRVPYMKILAVNKRGLSLLAKAKENTHIPVITRHSETINLSEEAKAVYDIQCKSSDKFAIFTDDVKGCSLEQKNSMIKI